MKINKAVDCCSQILVSRVLDRRARKIYPFEEDKIAGELSVAKFALRHTAKQSAHGRAMVRESVKKWVSYFNATGVKP